MLIKSTNRIRVPDHRRRISTPKVECGCVCVPEPWPLMADELKKKWRVVGTERQAE
jgi:hypothetical protein